MLFRNYFNFFKTNTLLDSAE